MCVCGGVGVWLLDQTSQGVAIPCLQKSTVSFKEKPWNVERRLVSQSGTKMRIGKGIGPSYSPILDESYHG